MLHLSKEKETELLRMSKNFITSLPPTVTIKPFKALLELCTYSEETYHGIKIYRDVYNSQFRADELHTMARKVVDEFNLVSTYLSVNNKDIPIQYVHVYMDELNTWLSMPTSFLYLPTYFFLFPKL